MNNLEMIKGSGGDLDYVVVCKPKGFIIGIKPMFEHQANRTFVGMRVRMIFDPSNEVPTINPKETLVNVFPKVKWASANKHRVSLVGGAVVGINHKDINGLHNWFIKQKIAKTLFKNLCSMVNGDDVILETIFMHYFSEKFLEEYKLPEIGEGDGNTVVNMFDYQKELNKPDAIPEDDDAQDDIDYPDKDANKDD